MIESTRAGDVANEKSSAIVNEGDLLKHRSENGTMPGTAVYGNAQLPHNEMLTFDEFMKATAEEKKLP